MNKKRGIRLNPLQYFSKQNHNFIDQVDPIIDDIFQTHRTDSNGYIHIGNYVLDQIREFAPFSERESAMQTYNKEITIEIVPGYSNISKAYENLIAHLMLNGNYDTYVIAGGMGTGKSSTCDFIVGLLIKKLDSKGDFIINIKFDFNGPYDGNEDEIMALFRRELFDKLHIEIETYLLENEQSLDDFCDILNNKHKRSEYSEFNMFRDHKNIDWKDNTIPLDDKIDRLFNYIATYEDKIIPLMKFVHFIAHNYKKNSVIFVFDNIDILSPVCQRRILYNVFKYNNIAKIKCFVPLRRATFKRTLREIQRDESFKSAYAFGYIHHHGVEPIKIVLERVNRFLEKKDQNISLQSISKNYQDHIVNRFEVYKHFLETENSFSKFFSCIIGRSSRLALSISRRFFINNVIEYTNHNIQYDMGIKAFMASDNPTFLFDNEREQEIANIFSFNYHGDFSFIPYIIMQLIHIAQQPEEYEIKYIYSEVVKFHRIGLVKQDFVDALNYILLVRRPLIWSDDKSFYNYDVDLETCSNTLQFTELGRGYYEIFRSNTQYLQECFMSLRWEHDYIPDEFDSFRISDRFAFIRKCILEIFLLEKKLIQYEQSIRPLSVILFTTVGNLFYSILNNSSKQGNTLVGVMRDEILNWKSFRNDLYNFYKFDTASNEKISRYLDSYQ